MNFWKHVAALALMLAVIAPGGAAAQNLLSNPHFITDLSGWAGSGWWSAEDCFNDPKTGSATYLNNDSGSINYYIVRQCVDLSPTERVFQMSAYFYIPSGQSASGWGQLGVAWYSAAGCTAASYLGGDDAPFVSDTGAWQQTSATTAAPPSAMSAYVYTVNQKISVGGSHQVYVDEVSFTFQTEVFSDGFESSDTTKWSATVP